MFTEFMRVKPILDPASAGKMERDLGSRFSRVAKRMQQGFKAALKGSIFGLSLGLLNRLLNPLEALEERVKKLLDRSSDVRDLADEFSSTPGAVAQLQTVGQSFGLDPEKLTDLVRKFQAAVETARKEIAQGVPLSQASLAVSPFAAETDTVEGFRRFLQGLNRLNTAELTQEQRRGLQLQGVFAPTGVDARKTVEREVFGAPLTGAAKRFAGQDILGTALTLGIPSTQAQGEAIAKGANLADKQARTRARNEAWDMVSATNSLNSTMIAQMEETKKREQAMLDAQLKNFDSLQKSAQGINEIKDQLIKISGPIVEGLGQLPTLIREIKDFASSGIWKKLLGSGR